MTKQTVILDPGQSQNITFETVPDIAKEYQVQVNGLNGSFNAIQSVPPGEAVVAGIVTDSNTGLPITNATVYLARSGQSPFTNTKTDAAGRYQFSWDGYGTHGIFVRHSSYYDSDWKIFTAILGTLIEINVVLNPK